MIVPVLKIALRALARNKVRSALTMLGIIIGVASVIAMVSLGQGAQKQVQDQISSMGTNLLIVQAGSQRTGGMRGGAGTSIHADAGRRGGDLRRRALGGGGQPSVAAPVTAGGGQSELDHASRRRRHHLSGDPPRGVSRGPVLHRCRCPIGGARGGDRRRPWSIS